MIHVASNPLCGFSAIACLGNSCPTLKLFITIEWLQEESGEKNENEKIKNRKVFMQNNSVLKLFQITQEKNNLSEVKNIFYVSIFSLIKDHNLWEKLKNSSSINNPECAQ